MDDPASDAPTLEDIRAARQRMRRLVVETPVRVLEGLAVERRLGATQVVLKEELFQRTGSFKPRGALTVMMALSPDELRRGVVTVSAGNHAMATAYAASALGTTALVVMPKTADPGRIQSCRDLGATVELTDTIHQAVERVYAIVRTDGRTLVHPFEGPGTALGTATLGLELAEQAPDLDAVIVPIGGGGLCAGVAAAVKLVAPRCQVFGVEPVGADSMHRSFAAGSPQSIEAVTTIADSLGAPFAAPYSFALCRRFVDDLVLVDDDALREAMLFVFETSKLAVEPAGAAATAALLGPLRARLDGKRVGVIICGGNVAPAMFAACLTSALAARS
jgi:threonine dehydratase